jgi:hypothetical protein
MTTIKIENSYPPIAETDLIQVMAELEARLEKKMELPDEYIQFLLTHNGGRPEPNVFPVFGDSVDDPLGSGEFAAPP